MAYSAEFSAAGLGLEQDVSIRLWSPDGLYSDAPAPLLLAHDGPEYDARASLTEHMAWLIQAGSVAPYRIALVDRAPGAMRNVWYGASPEYHSTLAHSVIPTIRERANVVGPIVGLGASLGAISLLGCEIDHPGTFGGLRLQSTSFHHQDYYEDWVQHEIRGQYGYFDRVAALVERIRAGQNTHDPVYLGMTWRDGPEKIGNTVIEELLANQGHLVHRRGGMVPGGHDFESWGRTFEPSLAFVLNRCWGNSQ